jgi:hypothetical protein
MAADGSGTAAGRDSSGPIPAPSYRHPAIPDQFTHDCNPAAKTPLFKRVIPLFPENRHKCLSMNNLRTKSSFLQSSLIVPNRAIFLHRNDPKSIPPIPYYSSHD